jgi:hypothetical protein
MVELSVTPQARRVLAHLEKRGSISPMEAIITYGITRLAARVHELRRIGMAVKTDLKRDAEGKPYARYTLA